MKHSSLLGQFISYEENEVLWIRPQVRCFLKFFYFILLVYSIIQPDSRILKNAMAGKAGQKNDVNKAPEPFVESICCQFWIGLWNSWQNVVAPTWNL